MRRHLPLLERPIAQRAALSSRPRLRLTSTVGIADTGDGDSAVDFALALACALTALGRLPHVALTAIAHVPALCATRRDRFAAAGVTWSAHAIAPSLEAPPPLGGTGLTLLVGVPALVLFEPGVAVLLEADRPLPRWPDALRGVGDAVDLAVASARPALVRRLAEQLVAAGGFLLPQEQGVG